MSVKDVVHCMHKGGVGNIKGHLVAREKMTKLQTANGPRNICIDCKNAVMEERAKIRKRELELRKGAVNGKT